MSADAVTSGYLLQGSIREAGDRIRAVVQLIDTQSGANVWADTFDRTLSGTSPFELQDDLRATIVATIADPNGALVRSMATALRSKPIDALTPYEAVLRGYVYISAITPAEHAVVRDALELAVRRAPTNASAWATLAHLYVDEYSLGFNVRPDPLGRARAATQRALEIDRPPNPRTLRSP